MDKNAQTMPPFDEFEYPNNATDSHKTHLQNPYMQKIGHGTGEYQQQDEI